MASDIRDELYEGMIYEKHGVGAGELDEQATVDLMRRGAAEIDRHRVELAERDEQEPVVPNGYALVPVEPTDRMIAEADNRWPAMRPPRKVLAATIWTNMLTAAPPAGRSVLPETLSRHEAESLCKLEGSCQRTGECHGDCECSPSVQQAWAELRGKLLQRMENNEEQ